MKKIFLIIVFQFFIIEIYAQEKAEPTKEETMDWIAEKMKQYLIAPWTFQSYENGLFVCKILKI